MLNAPLERQTILYKINLFNRPGTIPEETALSILKDIKAYVMQLRSDIEHVMLLETKDNSALFRFNMASRRPLRCGSPETNEEREESIKTLITQLVLENRTDCKSISVVLAI